MRIRLVTWLLCAVVAMPFAAARLFGSNCCTDDGYRASRDRRAAAWDWGALRCSYGHERRVTVVTRAPAPPPPELVRYVAVTPPPPPPPAPTPPPPVQGHCAVAYFPTGNRETSVLQLSKCGPAEVPLGAAFQYVITVRNISSMVLKNIIVTDHLHDGFTMSGAEPAITSRDGADAHWAMGNLAPGEARAVTISGSASAPGQLMNCATATFELDACLAISITNPQLALLKSEPDQVLRCEPIPVTLTVTNTGVGPARNVQVVDHLPDGLVADNDQTSVSFTAGTLAQGESRKFIFNARATRTGDFVNQAVATGDGGLRAEGSARTQVTAPVLSVTKTAPDKRYLGRPIEYDIIVTNTGNGVARHTVLDDPLLTSATLLSATEGGRMDGNRMTWQLGDLAPGESKRVSMTLRADRIGEVRNVATAHAVCADDASADAVTTIAGIPAVLLEVVDLTDPVEIGGETVYQITVTNQGSVADTNIALRCELEDTMQFVSASGATPATAEGGVIHLAPLASLAPQARATWQVRVKAVKPGDVRFTVTMNTDQIHRDVRETESTNFYE